MEQTLLMDGAFQGLPDNNVVFIDDVQEFVVAHANILADFTPVGTYLLNQFRRAAASQARTNTLQKRTAQSEDGTQARQAIAFSELKLVAKRTAPPIGGAEHINEYQTGSPLA